MFRGTLHYRTISPFSSKESEVRCCRTPETQTCFNVLVSREGTAEEKNVTRRILKDL